jgi:hypothetical protein
MLATLFLHCLLASGVRAFQTAPRASSFGRHTKHALSLAPLGGSGAHPSLQPRSATLDTTTRLAMVPKERTESEEALTDVDTRILREMLLQELDLQTEDDIRKLLERGTVKSTVNLKEEEQKAQQKAKDESAFDSTVIQTLTDTKLWKKMSAQTSDLFESAKIWIGNKVEQNLQVVAALGVFTWDRAVRDVARALPSAGTVAKRSINVLTNSSSYEEPKSATSVRDDLNRPSDEIKDVTRAIFDIFRGNGQPTKQGLRTVAQAGTANSADRQRKAFTQRRKLDRRDKDITRIAGGVVDATYELQRELQAESSVAGYKTKPLRQAIAARTTGILSAVKETARLVAAKRKEQLLLKEQTVKEELLLKEQTVKNQLLSKENPVEEELRLTEQAVEEVEEQLWLNEQAVEEQLLLTERAMEEDVDRSLVYAALVDERKAFDKRVTACIKEPENTWLLTPDEELAAETVRLDPAKLREVATLMVMLRNDRADRMPKNAPVDLSVADESVGPISQEQVEELLQQLRGDLEAIVELRSRVAGDVSLPIAEALFRSVVGFPDVAENDGDVPVDMPLILRLDEIEASLRPETLQENVFFADAASGGAKQGIPSGWAAAVASGQAKDTSRSRASARATTTEPTDDNAVFVDVDVVAEVIRKSSSIAEVIADQSNAVSGNKKATKFYKSFVAEIVSDDDFENAFSVAKSVETLSEDEAAVAEAEQELNPVVQLLLRALDVLLFVVEKTFTVILPSTVLYTKTAIQRLYEINRSGKGRRGWELLRRSADAKGRY